MQTLDDALAPLKGAADTVDAQFLAARKGNLGDALRLWHQIQEEYDALDTERKRIFAALEAMSRATIPEMMAEQDVKTITLDDIKVRFTVAQRFYCSMPDKDGGMEWLKANGLGDLIQETVNSGTLSSAAKKRIEGDGLEMPTEFFKTSYMSYTSATKVN